jgi:hypothetical protein
VIPFARKKQRRRPNLLQPLAHVVPTQDPQALQISAARRPGGQLEKAPDLSGVRVARMKSERRKAPDDTHRLPRERHGTEERDREVETPLRQEARE